ncbi:TetR/AcrR family transcriptional regulator [Corynebacterium sp. UBA2622]|uniref:TetR/AcrR family transcriptional regulator n=1 Tax=Corynebacterium sp. UBA2622 TaxID=1946393 RepID=UPI0025C0EAB0|nr:TetR/AcrR family transcriptional regulator [Corynebacterium sp. UBA2622]
MRKDAANNRAAIVGAARELIARDGVEVSMRAIAKEAGVGVATVTRHFPDRACLLHAVVEQGLASVDELVQASLPRFTDNPEDAWRSTIHAIVGLSLPIVAQQVMPSLATGLDPELVVRKTSILERIYRPFLVRAAEHGFCAPDLDAVHFHLGIIALSRPLPPPADKIFPDEMSWLVDVFIDGLR